MKDKQNFNSVSLTLGHEKNVLVLVIGRVDFDANKKNCGPQIITRYRLYLSIIDDQQTSLPLQKQVFSPILISKIRYYYVLPGLLRFLEMRNVFSSCT